MTKKKNKLNKPNNSYKQAVKVPSDPFADREASKYSEPVASREFILQIIKHNNNSINFKELLKQLDIKSKEQKNALDKRLSAMIRDGQVKIANNKYQAVSESELIEGEVLGHSDGFGFVRPHKKYNLDYDFYLPNYEMRKVLSGDIVEVLPNYDSKFQAKTKSRPKVEAKVVNIKQHTLKQLVGKVEQVEDDSFILKPEDTTITKRVEVVSDRSSLKIKNGQLVLAELTDPSYRGHRAHETIKVRVIEVIGDYFAPGVEIEAALRRFEIPHKWPAAVLEEAKQFASTVSEESKQDRIDLRNLPLVTIDGEDAKDFDDAVYCSRLPNGNYRLIVAIADVSYYVKPGSSLDGEAFTRGNSVYFPGRVIPMLPEALSNGLCSLNPSVDRLCFACESEIAVNGKVVRYRFFPAVMRSHARFTYTKVAKILVDKDPELTKQYSNLVEYLENLYSLYQVLLEQREHRGAIDFDSTETMIEFDDEKKIKAIHPVVRNDAHKLIEECMLVANVCAAHFCRKNKVDVLYRNHSSPPEDKVTKLQEFLKPLGLGLKKMPPKPKDIASLLVKSHDRPDTHVIQMVALRSLSQALYEPKNEGHFGLAYPEYTHFTSPIRRYPDLLLHRQLHHYLAKSKKWQSFAINDYKSLSKQHNAYFGNIKNNMANIGTHCSTTERRADEATRDVTAWLKCEYMQDKIGETFVGCISGVTNFGVFVELNDVYVEGLVHVTDLRGDYYFFDDRTHSLIGERTRHKYAIGDKLEVIVAKVDLDSRRIDFALAPSHLDSYARTGNTAREKNSGKPSRRNRHSKPQESRSSTHARSSNDSNDSRKKNKKAKKKIKKAKRSKRSR